MNLRDLRNPFKAHLFSSGAGVCYVEPGEEAGADAGGGETELHAALSAAYDAAESADTAAAPAAAAQTAERPAAAATTETPAQAAQRARDEQGRFAKPGETPAPKTDPQTPLVAAGPDAQAQITAPPSSWSAAAKAKFTALDPEIQQEVLKREKDMEQGKAQWQQGAERLNALDQVLGPRRQNLQIRGISEAQAVAALFAAQDQLETTPVDALLNLGRQFRVNWNAVFQRLQGGGGAQQPALPPGVDAIARQVHSLTQAEQQRQLAARQAVHDQSLSAIQQFKADPKNVYFENVAGRMGQLIASGEAKDLAGAYDQACWADPQVRPLMFKAQADEQARQTAEAARARTAGARHASGSVTGSPAPGASSGPSAAAPSTVLDALNQAWDQHAG